MEYSYKFRVYPTAAQARQIQRTFGCCRFVWNHYLALRKDFYEQDGKTMNYSTCSGDMTQLKKTLPWLREVDATALQSSLRDLDTAYQNFFRRVKQGQKPGYPKFKSKHHSKKSYKSKCVGTNIKVLDKAVQLPKLGFVKCRISKDVKGRILSATVSQNPSGEYFVALCCTDVEIVPLTSTGAVAGIDMGLKASASPAPHILEIGFGTGLNALLTLIEAERSGRQIHYTGIELYPLPWETVEKLRYNDRPGGDGEQRLTTGDEQTAQWMKALHTSPWGEDVRITPHFTLRKIQGDFTIMDRSSLITDRTSLFSLLYFDAFAPEKQPEMWTQELFDELYVMMEEEGILTTYCAKGVVRRMLQAAGFIVERLPGPPGGKREILRAKKRSQDSPAVTQCNAQPTLKQKG